MLTILKLHKARNENQTTFIRKPNHNVFPILNCLSKKQKQTD